MAIDVHQIRAADWAIKLGAAGEVVTELDDVAQCIDIIVNTPKGSVPLEPDFGCDAYLYLDQPASVAIPNIKRELLEAITRWEPRAKVASIVHEADEETGGVKFITTWQAQSGAARESSVTYALS